MDPEAGIQLNSENSNNQVLDSNIQESSDALQKRIKALLQENRSLKKKLLRKEENFQKTFNQDQLRYLELGTHKGFMWSDETLEKGMRLYFSCGAKGYEEIRSQNLPYPSIRTIQERLQGLKFQPGIVDDVLNILKQKVS